MNYPFNLKRRRTKSLLVDPTKPFFLIALLRLVDFLVRMCLLKAFWKVISPVPVTLKRFFALELVFTFGIIIILTITPCWRLRSGGALIGPCGKWMAKVAQNYLQPKKKGSRISGPTTKFILIFNVLHKVRHEKLVCRFFLTPCFRLEDGKHSFTF